MIKNLADVERWIQLQSHGHVFKREDGSSAKCMGVNHCDQCRYELIIKAAVDSANLLRKELQQIFEWSKIENIPLRQKEINSISKLLSDVNTISE